MDNMLNLAKENPALGVFVLYTVIFFNAFFSGMISTLVFSFAPKMVKYFGISEVNTGMYVGIVATSVYIGAVISSTIWGTLSDRKGRKFCLNIANVLSVGTTLAFGFSTDIYMAIATRFLQGLAFSQIVILKGILGQYCDASNRSQGFSVLLTAFNVGNIVGPSIGGFTAFPVDAYPDVFGGAELFKKYVVLLPNIIFAAGLLIGLVLTIFLLPDDKKHIEESELLLSDDREGASYGSQHLSHKDTTTESEGHHVSYCHSQSLVVERISFLEKVRSSDIMRVLFTRECLSCCFLLIIFAIVDIGFEQMFPVLASTTAEYKGMGFNPKDVGLALMIVSIILVFVQLTVLSKIGQYVKPTTLLIASNVIMMVFCPLLPLVPFINNNLVMWVALITVIFFVRVCVFLGYLAINLLITTAAAVDDLGTFNGLTMTASYVGRLIAPITCGSIYSWSLTNIKDLPTNQHPLGFPFDQFFTFFFLSLLSLFTAFFTTKLPKSMTVDEGGKEVRLEVSVMENSTGKQHRKT